MTANELQAQQLQVALGQALATGDQTAIATIQSQITALTGTPSSSPAPTSAQSLLDRWNGLSTPVKVGLGVVALLVIGALVRGRRRK